MILGDRGICGMLGVMNKPGVRGRGPVRSKALVLYDGSRTAHRSCGVALAEAFDRSPLAYQSLRRGGLTGQGPCGAILAGRMLLGEFLGDHRPGAGVSEQLAAGIRHYDQRVAGELDVGPAADLRCQSMTKPHGDFHGAARHQFCTQVVGQVAQLVDEILREHGHVHPVTALVLDDGQPWATDVAFVGSPACEARDGRSTDGS